MATKIRNQNLQSLCVTGDKLAVLNTKGDLLGYDGGHIRVPVGADKQVLISNSAITGGLSWINVSGLLYVNKTIPASNTVSNTAVETSFNSSYTIPANSLSVGDLLKIKLCGTYGTALVAPAFILRLKIGNTAVITTASIGLLGSLTNNGWSTEASCIVQSIGTSGTVDIQGRTDFGATPSTNLWPNTSLYTINTTLPQTISASVLWNGANASNTMTLRQMIVEIMR